MKTDNIVPINIIHKKDVNKIAGYLLEARREILNSNDDLSLLQATKITLIIYLCSSRFGKAINKESYSIQLLESLFLNNSISQKPWIYDYIDIDIIKGRQLKIESTVRIIYKVFGIERYEKLLGYALESLEYSEDEISKEIDEGP